MVKIRLKRLGRKARPFYRIVVTDIRNRRDGVPLAELGYYNPLTKDLKLDKASALEWLSKGAIPSETAKRLIDKASETGELIQLERKAPKKPAKAAPPAKPEEAKAEEVKAEEAPAAEAPKAEESKPEEPAPAEEAKAEEPAPAETEAVAAAE